MLVLGDTHYPGWRAWVDGREVPVAEANHLFRAVSVSSEDREVVFRFDSTSFRVGVLISLVSGLALLAAWWASAGQVGGRTLRDMEELGAHIRHWVIQLGLSGVLHAVA